MSSSLRASSAKAIKHAVEVTSAATQSHTGTLLSSSASQASQRFLFGYQEDADTEENQLQTSAATSTLAPNSNKSPDALAASHEQYPPMLQTVKAQFRLVSYDSPVLIGVSNRLRATGTAVGLEASGMIPLPKKIKRFTLLRSPFVDKHSRTQLEVRFYRSLIEFLFPQDKPILINNYYAVIDRLRKNIPSSTGSSVQTKHIYTPVNWEATKKSYYEKMKEQREKEGNDLNNKDNDEKKIWH